MSLAGDPRPLQEWAAPLNTALTLFAFCVDRPLVPERLLARPHDGEVIDLHARWRQPDAPTNTLPLLTLPGLGNDLERVVVGWERLWAGSRDFVAHVTEYQLRRNRLTVEERALLMVRSLELYHRFADRFASRTREAKTHSALVDQVIANLPPALSQHSDWIGGALREANRKRLSGQLADILEDLGKETCQACGISDDYAGFVRIAVATRNHYTHPSSEPASAVAKGRSLLVLANRLWFLVRACVLIELGLTREQAATALKRSARKAYLLDDAAP